jgi:hypothetical protein
VRNRLSKSEMDAALDVMKEPLRAGQPGQALDKCVRLLGTLLDRTEAQAQSDHAAQLRKMG